jgi:hypothetical protein
MTIDASDLSYVRDKGCIGARLLCRDSLQRLLRMIACHSAGIRWADWLNRRREVLITLIFTSFSGLSWILGFIFDEDSSGGAAYDFKTFHWRASQMFADEPFWTVVRNYPSATTPLQHILMASLPWVHDAFAYRLTSFLLGTVCLVVFGLAVKRRFEALYPTNTIAVLATAAVALSPGFRSATFWGDTDALPLLFTAIVCLTLHDRSSGTWRESLSPGRIIAVAAAGAAAFYTRQLYIFVPIWSFWLLWPRVKDNRLTLVLTFVLMAVPAAVLFWLWRGLTPPLFRPGGTAASVLYVGALAAPFALPFVFARKISELRGLSLSTLATLSVVFLLFLVAFHHVTLTAYGGGLATKIGLLLGPVGLPFVALVSVVGWWAIANTVMSGGDNAILFGFAVAPLLLASYFFQRYFDPLAFTIVVLLSSPPLSSRLVTGRSMMAGYLFFLSLEVIAVAWYVIGNHVNHNV